MSIVTFFFLVGLLAGIWWLISFGPAYWDNVGIKGDVYEAANMCMKEGDDEVVRKWLLYRLQSTYKDLNVTPDDVHIDRQPHISVAIDLSYRRMVKPLLVSDERTIVFNRHVDQDLRPVKW